MAAFVKGCQMPAHIAKHWKNGTRIRGQASDKPRGRKPQCSKSKGQRRIARWEHQDQIDRMNDVMATMPDSMLIRKQTVEHPLGTVKCWMGATHFLARRLKNVSTEMNLHVLAYNLRRMISIHGPDKLIAAMAT
jgi:hypothetical protein